MLGNITNFLIEGQFIIFVICACVMALGIVVFVCNQIINLMKLDKTIQTDLLNPIDEDELNAEIKPFGFKYTLNQDIFFSLMHPWQREYGYCRSYDEAAPLLCMIIDSEPIYFDYDNRKWLIELWKGQYGMTTGAEIGIYVANNENDYIDNIIDEVIYDSVSDNELLHMSYILNKKGNALLTRNDKHWWLTGFKLGEFSKPSELIMHIEITLKNEEMRDAFINGLKKAGYKDKDIKIFFNTVYLTFNKPHTKQPITRNKFITYIMQKYNKNNCKLYNSITKEYDNSLDKINYIRSKFPMMYSQIMNNNNMERLYKNYRPTKKK